VALRPEQQPYSFNGSDRSSVINRGNGEHSPEQLAQRRMEISPMLALPDPGIQYMANAEAQMYANFQNQNNMADRQSSMHPEKKSRRSPPSRPRTQKKQKDHMNSVGFDQVNSMFLERMMADSRGLHNPAHQIDSDQFRSNLARLEYSTRPESDPNRGLQGRLDQDFLESFDHASNRVQQNPGRYGSDLTLGYPNPGSYAQDRSMGRLEHGLNRSPQNVEQGLNRVQHSALRLNQDLNRVQHSPDLTRSQQNPGNVDQGLNRIQHSPGRTNPNFTRSPQNPGNVDQGLNRIQHSPGRTNSDFTRSQQNPGNVEQGLNRVQHSPGRSNPDFTRSQHNPGNVEQDLIRVQHSPGHSNPDLTRSQHNPGNVEQNLNRVQNSPGRSNLDLTRSHHNPGNVEQALNRVQHSPGRSNPDLKRSYEQDLNRSQGRFDPDLNRELQIPVRLSIEPIKKVTDEGVSQPISEIKSDRDSGNPLCLAKDAVATSQDYTVANPQPPVEITSCEPVGKESQKSPVQLMADSAVSTVRFFGFS